MCNGWGLFMKLGSSARAAEKIEAFAPCRPIGRTSLDSRGRPTRRPSDRLAAGGWRNSGNQNQSFSASECLTYTQSATGCFTVYQAGQWATGSYGFTSITFNGAGNAN